MKQTRAYLIQSVTPRMISTVSSTLIPDGSEWMEPNPCNECIFLTSRKPSNIFVQGFNDLLSFDLSPPGFLPSGPPMIAGRDWTVRICRAVSGCVPVMVGYRQWEQTPIDNSDEWFSRKPLLGAIVVNSICEKAYSIDGKELPHCSTCGLQKVPTRFIDNPDELLLDRTSFPPTDLFLLRGRGQNTGVVITDNGIARLHSLGFTNLKLAEVAVRL